MGDLRIENPTTTEAFVQMFALAGVALPLRVDTEDVGVLRDANGTAILTVDMHRDMPDDHVDAIALLVELAVNTCGSFALTKLQP